MRLVSWHVSCLGDTALRCVLVTMVEGVFPEYVAGAKKVTPAEEFPQWEAGVHALYDQLVRIDITPTWVRSQTFETRIPKAVEDLARRKFGDR